MSIFYATALAKALREALVSITPNPYWISKAELPEFVETSQSPASAYCFLGLLEILPLRQLLGLPNSQPMFARTFMPYI